MLEPDQRDNVLGSATGTLYRGTERISSNALLNLLEVGPDPVIRQKMGKRVIREEYVHCQPFRFDPNWKSYSLQTSYSRRS